MQHQPYYHCPGSSTLPDLWIQYMLLPDSRRTTPIIRVIDPAEEPKVVIW